MKLFEILSPTPRVIVATSRFRETFKSFQRDYPQIEKILRDFIKFRLSHGIEAYGKKDTPFIHSGLQGIRHLHMVFGRVVLFYQITSSEIRLLLISDHSYDDSKRLARLIEYLQSNAVLTPIASRDDKVLTAEQISNLQSLLYEFAAEDREVLERAIRGDVSELFEYCRLLVDPSWTDADKDDAIVRAFGDRTKLIAAIHKVLNQTLSRD